MSISKILNSLEKSWERDDILLKIKNGLDSDKKGLFIDRVDNEYVYNYVHRKRDSVFKSYYGDIQNNRVVRQIL